MSKTDVLKMLKDELLSNVDQDTLKKLGKVNSKEETLSILEEASIELSDDMLSAISGGTEVELDPLDSAEDAAFGGIEANWCPLHSYCPSYDPPSSHRRR